MRKWLAAIPAFIALSCLGPKEHFDVLRKFPNPKLTPPGTIWLRDNLFIDEAEISNFSYLEFLYWLKRKTPESYYLMLPDTDCWTHSDIGSADKLIHEYASHSAYRSYPAIGISLAQAEEFCRWRTDRVNEFLFIKEKKLRFHPDSNYTDRAPKKVLYRLPTADEWEYAAAAGLDYCTFPMGYEKLTSYNVPVNNTLEYHNYFIKDFRAIDLQCNNPIEVACPTVQIFSGKPNRYGLYQMLGNVSEMTADSVIKGLSYSDPLFTIDRSESESGSYTLNAYSYSYSLRKRYVKPEPWIGFRCVCEVRQP